jgi:hypothetical protein
MQSQNPLAKHFRQAAIYMSLPSEGKYWPDGSLDLPMGGQIAVYPMTTRDEITVRTPDALLNGESVVSIIQSCCPQIKDAWKMPSIDVDATLIAIRIASYGQEMDIDTICPNDACKHENKHGMDLTAVLDGIRAPNYNAPVEIQNLKIKLKPQSYFEANKINLSSFEEQRLMQVVNNDDLPDDEKLKQYQQHMNALIDINLNIIAAGTEYIETDEGIKVSDTSFIKEFYDNADTKIIKAVRDRFDEYNKTAELPRPRVKCEACETDYPVEIRFDYASFFDNAS